MKTNPMLHFGEVNYPEPGYMPAYSQPGDYIHADLSDGQLVVEVDCYSATDDSGEGFDMERWEAEKFILDAPPSRATWKAMFGMARGFLNGRKLFFNDQDGPIGLADWLNRVRAA